MVSWRLGFKLEGNLLQSFANLRNGSFSIVIQMTKWSLAR